jgi:YHS domain-containing protein
MKIITLAFTLLLISFPAVAENTAEPKPWLTRVEDNSFVCMSTDKVFKRSLLRVEVENLSYYVHCPGCKHKIENEASNRTAVDPISGAEVDKAGAIIGSTPSRKVYYFESIDNFTAFSMQAMPEEAKEEMDE